MAKVAKRLVAIRKKYDFTIERALKEAVSIIKDCASAKFDESFDIAVRLGVDPRKTDQIVRGSVSLPHGTGKSVRVLVLAKTPKDTEALNAGADYAGLEEYTEKIKNGWLEFDVVVATPDVMGEVGKLARILGPRGLMPNPKSGTVTLDIAKAVQEVKAGKIEYRVDKSGIVHGSIGKCSFSPEKIAENATAFFSSVLRSKPSGAKGKYVKTIYFSSTMGPGVPVNEQSFQSSDK